MEKQKLQAPIKVILADDHEIFRDGFRVMLKKQPSIELIGQAENGQELLEQVRSLKPDVVVTDIKMPVMDGIEATRILIKENADLGIIALSMFDEENLIMDMLNAGAKGYLLKNAHKNEIFEAIRTVYKKDNYYCNHTSAKLIGMLAKSNHNKPKKEVKIEFNNNEIEIIKMICREKSTKEIAQQLFLSARTVEKYRERIQEKIDAKNMVGVVLFAVRNGIYSIT
jgi:DNA-binding NarL/FixJ family response regulator